MFIAVGEKLTGIWRSLTVAGLLAAALPLQAEMIVEEHVLAESEQSCLMEAISHAKAHVTVGQLRAQCRQRVKAMSAAEVMSDYQRRERDGERYKIEPHNSTYMLLVGHQKGASGNDESPKPRSTEAKYQISFKSKIEDNLFGGNADLYFGYSQTSLWQVYDQDGSAPFRESNYSPELFLDMPLNWHWGHLNIFSWRLGVIHTSNGRGPDYSRSWNRVYADLYMKHGNAWLAIRPWWRIPDDEDKDDNPDITKYLGHGDLRVGYHWDKHRLSLMTRNYLEGSDKGAFQLDYTYPFTKYFRWHVQAFNGYGDSLLDYNESVSRFSIGIMLENGLY